MKTYNDVYLDARREFRLAGVEDYQLEARLLVCAAAGKTREAYFRDLNYYVTPDFEKKVADMVARRIAGEPSAYITGEWEFMGIPLKVTKDVLIPRDDTEVLAGTAIDMLRTKDISGTRVLDLCTGSGCVGIAVASNVPDCRIVCIDKYYEATVICRENVERNRLTRCITCLQSDALQSPPMLLGRFDLIVCNPPYIRTEELETLDASVRDYEPHTALDGGEDGLMFYRAVAGQWKSVLKDNGWLIFEVGEDQAEDVSRILRRNGFTDIRRFRDTMEVERVVAGRVTNPRSIRIGG